MKLEIGKNIRKLRRDADMTQEELAERLGVSYQAVSRWENNSTYPDIELLPVLAGMFGCTLDELVGEAKGDKIQRYYNAYGDLPPEDTAGKCELLRRAFAEFPNEFDFGRFLCYQLAYNCDIRDEKVADELHRVATDILNRCTDNAELRTNVIESFARGATDEYLGDFLERYAPAYIITKSSLLCERYRERGEHDAYNIVAGMDAIDAIGDIFYTKFHPTTSSPAADLPSLLAKLDFVNGVIGIDDEQRRTHPVYADGLPDAWTDERILCGLRISCRLAATGKVDEALDLLEEITALYEKFYSSVKEGDVLSYRVDSAGVTDIVIYAVENFEGWKLVRAHSSVENKTALEKVHLSPIDTERYAGGDYNILAKRKGWEWFDPIREHPRYLACMERMEKAGKIG